MLLPLGSAYQQDYYTNQTSSSISFGYTIYNSLNDTLNNCETTLDYYTDISNTLGTNYNYLFKLYINGNLNFSATLASSGNQSCLLLTSRKVYNSSYRNATFSFQSFSGGGIPVTIRAESHISCNSNDTDVTFDGGKIHGNAGSGGYQVPASGGYGTFLQPDHIFGHCNGQLPASGWSGSIGCSGCKVVEYTYPFFSGNGSVFLNITDPGCTGGTPAPTCSIYNTATNVTTFLFSCGGTASELNYSMALQSLTEYRLICSYYLYNAVVNPWSMPPLPFFMIISDIVPDYSCAFTSCSNGSRQYVCTDLKGNFPDTITDIDCLGVNQTIEMGFEDIRPVTEQVCVKANWFICNDIINNISAGLPHSPDWSVFPFNISGTGLNQYFATMVAGGSKGSFSFRMWSIPPSPPVQPTLLNSTSIVCDNVSVGSIPDIFVPGLNATFFTARNFTFPSDTMHILFDVKKCSEPVVQYDGWCGKSCFSYLGNCSISPKGGYFVSVYDNTLGQTAVLYTDISADNWSSRDMDVSNHITYPDHSYTLIFGVGEYPQDAYSPYSWCSQFDNVRLFNAVNGSLDEICLSLYGAVCDELSPAQLANVQAHYCQSNACQGNNRVISSLQSDVCVSQTIYNDSACVSANPANKTTGSQSIFSPISSIADGGLSDNWKAAGFGFALIFLTPVFWLLLIVAAVMMIAAYYTKHMEIGIGAGLLMLCAFTFTMAELLPITVILVVITVYLIGRSVVKTVAGGGS
jgi:hypothetical protein